MFNWEKKKALLKFEDVQKVYEVKGQEVHKQVESLYSLRKDAVREIEKAVDVLIKIQDFDLKNIRLISEEISSIRLFTEAVQYEGSPEKISNMSNGEIISVLGVNTAMAMTTTFGVISTRKAISTLSGSITTGVLGSALKNGLATGFAIGSSGIITGGRVILSMCGPIGWAIGVGAVWYSLFRLLFRFKRDKNVVDKINKMIEEMQGIIDRLNSTIQNIQQSKVRVEKDRAKLSFYMKKLKENRYTKTDFDEIVNVIKSLCCEIDKKFTL